MAIVIKESAVHIKSGGVLWVFHDFPIIQFWDLRKYRLAFKKQKRGE